MTQKNDTIPLILALLITGGILGGGAWWWTQNRSPVSTSPNNRTSNRQTSSSTPTSNNPALTTFAEVENVPSGLFNYGGSTTWATIRQTVDPALQTVHPNFKLRYTQPLSAPPGSGTGIKMLLEEQLAFSQSSCPLKDSEYEQAQQRGFTLQQIPVAIDGIAIAVHPDLNLEGLTVAQLKAIYTGNITNWSQVGGENLPIIPYSRPVEAGGTIEFFVDNILGKEAFGDRVQLIATTTEALRQVAQNRGALYFASAPEVVPQCTVKTIAVGLTGNDLVTPYQEPFVPLSDCPNRRNLLNKPAFQDGSYPITRRLFVIVKQNGQTDEQAGLSYSQLLLTQQGQQLIAEAGFVPIQ